jgi:hypothetical protein
LQTAQGASPANVYAPLAVPDIHYEEKPPFAQIGESEN